MLKNKKRLYESIMSSISKELKKTLNEGAGSAYEIKIKDLNATNIIIKGYDFIGQDEIVKFKANIKPGISWWSAEDYYTGVSADGIEYDGIILEEYDDIDMQVDGGTIEGYAYLMDIENNEELDEILKYIVDHLCDFSITVQYGNGYIHSYLKNPMVFNNVEVDVKNPYYSSETLYLKEIKIDAENIVNNINWFFENNHNFDKIFDLDN